MKKLFSIALSILALISCFTFTAAAEEGVNVALNAPYAYNDGVVFGDPPALDDSACTILTDGVVPKNYELAGETVGVTGTGATVVLTIDLGAVYSDITSIKFLNVNDSLGDAASNRGFSGEDTKFHFSATDATGLTRNKNFTMTRDALSDNEKLHFYDFTFTFDEPVKARLVQITMNAGKNMDAIETLGYIQGYVLSLGEVEVISASGVAESGDTTDVPDDGVSADDPVDDPDASEDASVDASEDASVDASVDASADAPAGTDDKASADASVDASADAPAGTDDKASADASDDASASTSKDSSKADTSSAEDEGGMSPVIIVVIIVVVVAVVAVVVIMMKKKKAK